VTENSVSIDANYIEANEALSKKDFIMRLKISLKEAKETQYWLNVILKSYDMENPVKTEINRLLGEAMELRKILASIFLKSK
jgi:four helix bundle protein